MLIVHTGNGKGKTTAALGTALRAAGHGMKVLILQFIKGTWHSGELEALGRIPEITLKRLGGGFIRSAEDLERERRLAREGWEEALVAISGDGYDMVILDELNYAIGYGLLSAPEVTAGLARRREGLHVIVTGRNAPPELIEAADLVTEMREVKHPFAETGTKAQKGIEF